MVRFHIHIGRYNKAYFPRELRESLGSSDLEVVPDTHAALIFPREVSLKSVIRGCEILLEDLRHQLELEQQGAGRKPRHEQD